MSDPRLAEAWANVRTQWRKALDAWTPALYSLLRSLLNVLCCLSVIGMWSPDPWWQGFAFANIVLLPMLYTSIGLTQKASDQTGEALALLGEGRRSRKAYEAADR